MSEISFYTLNEEQKVILLETHLGNKGKIISKASGLCGDIYIFDQGEVVSPRYVCAKVPKLLGNCTEAESSARFVDELKIQLSFYGHVFVHWAFDLTTVMGAPVALFRYWGGDLSTLIRGSSVSDVQKLSILSYVCVALQHCYNSGLVSHQDLKPANIFLRNLEEQFSKLPELDIYIFALLADFGLANASVNSNVFDGSRPYMAPEQFERSSLSSKTDVFALGVILCELMTNGYHPIGINLSEFWPQPINGNSKKWTRANPWRKWASEEEKIDNSVITKIDPDILSLVKKMISTNVEDRPTIDVVLSTLLFLIKARCKDSHDQVDFLIRYYNEKSSNAPIKEQWPYVYNSWKKFQSNFNNNT